MAMQLISYLCFKYIFYKIILHIVDILIINLNNIKFAGFKAHWFNFFNLYKLNENTLKYSAKSELLIPQKFMSDSFKIFSHYFLFTDILFCTFLAMLGNRIICYWKSSPQRAEFVLFY